MTLLEILVKELPGRGGWPSESIHALVQGHAGNIYRAGGGSSLLGCELADDWRLAEVTREQYEASLSASKKPEWNGEGLPPVGCECEMKRVADWMPVTIKFISGYHTVFTTFGGTEDCYQTTSLQFRPIRSEADRKRDEAVGAMLNAQSYGGQDIYCDIYDAIAAGKVPGIRIE